MSFNPKNYYLKRLPINERKSRLSFYHFIQKETTVGRHQHSNFLLNGGKTSKNHAIIEFRGGKMFLKDLNTKIGTYVNGVKYRNEEVELTEHMIIGFGYNHCFPEHMEDERSAIYQIATPEIIDLDSDSDYESDEVVNVIQHENQKNQKNQNVESFETVELSESEPNDSDSDDENSTSKTDKNIQNNQISSNTEEKSTKSSQRTENLTRLKNDLQELDKKFAQLKESHQNLTKNVEQLPKRIEEFDKNYKKISKPPPRRLSILIPPNINQNLLKNVHNLQLPNVSKLSKNFNRNSSILRQNCEDLVELAKNLQGERGIRTVTKAAMEEVRKSFESVQNCAVEESQNNGKEFDEPMEIENEINNNEDSSSISDKFLNCSGSSSKHSENSSISSKNDQEKPQNFYKNIESCQKSPEKSSEELKNIPITTSTTRKTFSFPSINDKPTTSKTPISFPQIEKPSTNNEIPSSQESLLEEIQVKKVPVRRESIYLPRKRPRTKSNWSTNPGMVKVIKSAKRMKLGERLPGNDNRIAAQKVSSPTISEKPSDEPSASKIPTGPQKRPPIQRRKSVFQQQNELVSDNIKISDKEVIIRRWDRQQIQLIDELPSMPSAPNKRGRKPKNNK